MQNNKFGLEKVLISRKSSKSKVELNPKRRRSSSSQVDDAVETESTTSAGTEKMEMET